MIVVTSGISYLDMDAYAGCIAYAELLCLQGHEAVAASGAECNSSVPQSLRGLGQKFFPYTPKTEDAFVLIDVSDKDFFDPLVAEDRIVEVIDHHAGFAEYWKETLGSNAEIELVGAACTQIFERWQRAGLLSRMSRGSAALLAAGILDNTLNFQARVTGDRDRAAYVWLEHSAGLPADWPARYFLECQAAIESDLEAALRSDCKTLKPSPYLPGAFAQLAVWDAQSILEKNSRILTATLRALHEDWVLNLISIGEGKSYFVSDNPLSRKKITKLLGCSFTSSVADAGRVWLRKEIFKEALRCQGGGWTMANEPEKKI